MTIIADRYYGIILAYSGHTVTGVELEPLNQADFDAILNVREDPSGVALYVAKNKGKHSEEWLNTVWYLSTCSKDDLFKYISLWDYLSQINERYAGLSDDDAANSLPF